MREETKIKISLANKGRVFSEEWKKNLSIAHKGKPSQRKGKVFVDKTISKAKRAKYRKEWAQKNKLRILELDRKWKKENMPKVLYQARLRYHNNPQKELDRIRFKKYGITGSDFRNMLNDQNSKCPICNKNITKNLSVDHDHITGKIRGLICNKCNLSIGNAEDSPVRLRLMADYLEGKL